MTKVPEWITFSGQRYGLSFKYENREMVDRKQFDRSIEQLNKVHGTDHEPDGVIREALERLVRDRFLIPKELHDHCGFTSGRKDSMSIYLYCYFTQEYGLHEYRLSGYSNGKVILFISAHPAICG